MFRRYHHGHSIAVGFLLALAMQRHMLLFVVLVFAAGVVAGRAWSFFSDVAYAVRGKLLNAAKRERIHFTPQPVYTLRRHKAADEQVPF